MEYDKLKNAKNIFIQWFLDFEFYLMLYFLVHGFYRGGFRMLELNLFLILNDLGLFEVQSIKLRGF